MNSTIKRYNRSKAREALPTLLDELKESDGLVYIAERGEIEAVLMPIEKFKKLTQKSKPKKTQAQHLLELAGMWKDRKDMEDSVAWVNKLRSEEDNRYNRP